MPDIAEVDPHDDAALRAWYATLHAGATAGRPAPVVSTYAAMASSFRDPGPARHRLPVAATEGGETVGALLVELPLIEDLSTAEVEVDVPPQHRGRGVGTALWRWAAHRVAARGRTVVRSEVHVPAGRSGRTWPGARFAARLGFVSVHVEDHLVLPLPARVPVPPTPAGLELVTWAGVCPARWRDDFAAMHTVMSADVPSGGADRDTVVWDAERIRVNEDRLARNHLSLVCLARTADGAPAGYTQAFIVADDSEHVLQDDTFVAREHRGRRLSAVLKAVNLARIERHRGSRRALHTWTSDENPAMRRVNDDFGFRVVERTHTYELR